MAKVKAKKARPISSPLARSMREEIDEAKDPEEIMSLNSPEVPLTVKDVISTGLPNLDKNLACSVDGRWGLPVGRIISVKAKPSVGKTSFLLNVAREVVRRGGSGHVVESEHALDLSYCKKICPGFEENFFISQPEILEGAFQAIEHAIDMCIIARKKSHSDAPFVILVDSFSGFMTGAELDGDYTNRGKALGEHARLASLACRKLTGQLARARATLLLSHQTKAKIGVFWGNPDTNIGGDAFNYHDSICISLYRTAALKDGKQINGHYGVAKTTKNKLFPPFREARIKVVNGLGFSKHFAIFDMLMSNGTLKKSGAWYKLEGYPDKFQGESGFSKFLRNPKARAAVLKAMKV